MHRSNSRRSALPVVSILVVALLLLSGCDDSDAVSVGNPQPTIADFAGSDQITDAGGTLDTPLSIVVTNDDGAVEGVRVSWSSGEGTLTGDTRTDSSGVATATWTLGGGVQRRFAVATGSIASSFVNFVAFVVPADDVIVVLKEDAFVPSAVTVDPGTTVTWIWPSTTTDHNLEPIGGSVLPTRSGDPVDGPFLYSQEILFSGLFNYQCASHGAQGTISAGP